MDLETTAEDQRFREEVRTWLEENVPRDPRPCTEAEARPYDMAWQRAQYDGGWAGVAWPKEYGGRGLSLVQQMTWHEEYARADGPYIGCGFVGINHAGPTLITCARDEQKAFHLPKILKGEAVWCQGFSEPGAGSDLAGLQTRAVVDGDQLVVNGQKIWTSFADVADYQELLVRTNPDASKHAGISWVIGDMRLPGIEIRPIRTMDGGAEFCEVFYRDVRIPLANVVGRVDDGWSVAMSTLGFERGTAFMGRQVELARSVEKLIALAKQRPSPAGRGSAFGDDEIAYRLATLRAEVTAMRAMTVTSVSRARRSPVPGPEGSMLKIFLGDLEQRLRRLAMEILGPEGLVMGETADAWTNAYLRSYASTIGGGTSEIQRNIVGERVLGLPKDR
jgi:alkylation response protein AidB-like acyl-CoA dehydrogenase